MTLPTSTSHYHQSYTLIPYDLLEIAAEYHFDLCTIKTYLYLCFHANSDAVCDAPPDVIASHLGYNRKNVMYAIADLDSVDLIIADGKGIIIPDFAAWTMGVKP